MRLLRWYQIDLQRTFLTVGESKTPHGEHRVVPLIGPALEAMENWAALFPERLPDHFVFPAEKYALNSNANQVRIYNHVPEKPMGLGSGHGKQRADVPVPSATDSWK